MIFTTLPPVWGIEQAESMLLPSPFDYTRQALLCVLRKFHRKPTSPARRATVGCYAQGRLSKPITGDVLCQHPHAMMRDLAERFRATMTLPVLLQGETSKGQLLQQFVSAGNAARRHSAASGRGGRARRYVIVGDIDKLPFTSRTTRR